MALDSWLDLFPRTDLFPLPYESSSAIKALDVLGGSLQLLGIKNCILPVEVLGNIIRRCRGIKMCG